MTLFQNSRLRPLIGALGAACFVATAAATFNPAPAQAATITAVMQQPLRSVDPIITTAYILRNFGYMIYDTLVAYDADDQIKPQMLEKWEVSDDKKTYTFILRDGLKWSDGSPVTAKDCMASIKRWAAVDKEGQIMTGLLESTELIDDKSWSMTFKTATDIGLRALAKPSGVPAFMMPEKIASTPASQAITETIGSGPFRFVADQYQPGIQAVFVKNEHYVPRDEPASGLAGGKVVHVDEIKWVSMPDTMTAVNALLNNEVNFLERAPYDLLPMIEKDPKLKLVVLPRIDQLPIARFNFLNPPFDNKKIRQAAMLAYNQVDVLQAQTGNDKYYKPCYSVYGCGGVYENSAAADEYGRGNIEKAKALLKEANYDGTPVVILHPADNPMTAANTLVQANALKKAGFNVDVQTMDWQTLLTRRASQKPQSEGGWNVIGTALGVADTMDPLSNFALAANGKDAWVGWPDVPEIEALRSEFAQTSDPDKLKEIATEIQRLALENGVVVPLGQDSMPMAMSKSISGFIRTHALVFWNVKVAD